MLFNQEFIDFVELQPVEGIVKACDIAFSKQHDLDEGRGWNEEQHELLWEAVTFIDTLATTHNINVEAYPPDPAINLGTNCSNLMDYLEKVSSVVRAQLTSLKIESYRNKYAAALKSGFAYEFSQGDLNRVQQLVNEIREHISANESLEEDHKRRLLKRLEYLQSEIHKRVSDLDRFWGLVGDAGVVLGKLGKDARPIFDRVKEVAEIVWRTQARSEELPSDSSNPMLERGDEDE